MTEHTFLKLTGREPVDDDMARVNCKKAGELGHNFCGFCHEHELPRMICGCSHTNTTQEEDEKIIKKKKV